MARTRLAILYGGRSAEHQVSVVSARSVMEALDPDRFEVVPIAITRDGAWLLPDRSPLELTASDGTLPEVEAAGRELAVRPEEGVGGVDVVFPILHGPLGEDGTVQGLFELADLPYVGSGVLASALAMDKAMAKQVLAANGIPQARYRAFAEHQLEGWEFDVLSALRRAGAPYELSPGSLMQQTLVTSGTMTNRVDRLEKRGFVRRGPAPSDRRGVLVRLTDEGRQVVDAAMADLLGREQELLSHLPVRERERLATSLRTLLGALES